MSFFGLGNQSLQIHGTETLKDWAHASKTFLSNGYQLVPRYKFLFHVYFNLNTSEIPQLAAAYGSGNINSIGLMVKSVELPKFKIDTQVLNQYNRKRVTQSKIHYEPARIVFHDDQSDLIVDCGIIIFHTIIKIQANHTTMYQRHRAVSGRSPQ